MRHILHYPVHFAAMPVAFLLMTGTGFMPPTGAQQKDPSLLHIGQPIVVSKKAIKFVPVRVMIPVTRWGAKDRSGLQLGIYPGPSENCLHCLIRNAGAHTVKMNTYQFGCPGYVKVYARVAGTKEWTEVSGGTCAHGVGPRARDNVTVQPGQYLIADNQVSGIGTKDRVLIRIECSFSAIADFHRLPNPDLKPVEIRVEHRLPNDGSPGVWQGTLSSPIITMPMKPPPAAPGPTP